MRGSAAAFAPNPTSSPPRTPGYFCGTTPSNNPASRRGTRVASTPTCTPPPAWLLRYTKWIGCAPTNPVTDRSGVTCPQGDRRQGVDLSRPPSWTPTPSPYPYPSAVAHLLRTRLDLHPSRCGTPRRFSPTADSPTCGRTPSTNPLPPACVLPCDWETCDTGGSLAVRPDPTRRAGTVDAVPPPRAVGSAFLRIDPGTRTMSMTFIQDRALTTTAHSGRHVANRSL